MMELSTDNRQGVNANLNELQNPSWIDVEQAIKALNGQNHTEVLLDIGPSYISVCGGSKGYFVYIYTEDERNLILEEGQKFSGLIELVTAGNSCDYPAKQVVALDHALAAAKTFYAKGIADPKFSWLED
ncbi:Imm1 family immunity protein [Spartinivicinus ruber]|uniref:Imm1 family immunity protein n=1 Tax=Spartinivicinus ruber TaxID=2683272 RepID=UPI0013D40A5F|nr:Imm1 family immunity protein [Spartinivicinus ruber]